VSGVLPVPGVQLTMPPPASVGPPALRVRVVTAPVRASVSVTRPPVAPVGPCVPMKSPWIVIRRAVWVVSVART
jgi:hypothetical protein